MVAERELLMKTKPTVAALVPGFMGSTANAATFNFTDTNISGPTVLLLIGLGLVGLAALAIAWRRHR